MGKTREIKKRIKAVGNIRRITKTMQMIATSKFSRAQQAAVAGRPYTETLFELVTELARSISDISHQLLDSGSETAKPGAAKATGGQAGKKAAPKDLTLIITSDRGLAGPYNGNVLRAAMALFKSTPSTKEGVIDIVGKKGAGFLRFAGIEVSKQHTQFGDKPSYANVRALGDDYIQRFRDGEIGTVRVVYMKYISAGRQSPTVLQLVPFKAAPGEGIAKAEKKTDAKGYTPQYEFSPDAQTLLDDLLPAAVKAVLFQAFNDAVVSEHVARMVAMKSATDNAGKMGKRLTRVYNRARQAQITTELTEIISGAAALG